MQIFQLKFLIPLHMHFRIVPATPQQFRFLEIPILCLRGGHSMAVTILASFLLCGGPIPR